MRYVLSRINIFNLLICQSISNFFLNRLISLFNSNDINTNKKSLEKRFIERKSIRNSDIIKIIQIDNIFSTNILIFCDSKNENENSILSLFVKSKNIKNRLTFLFFDIYSSV